MSGPKGEYWNRANHVVLGDRKAVATMTHHYNMQRVWLVTYGWWGSTVSTLASVFSLQLLGYSIVGQLMGAAIVSSALHLAVRGWLSYSYTFGPSANERKAIQQAEKAREARERKRMQAGG